MIKGSQLKAFTKYEKRLCLLIFISTLTNAMNTFQFLATHYTPPYQCYSSAYTKHPQRNESVPFNSTTEEVVNGSLSKDACFPVHTQIKGSNETNNTNLCESYVYEGKVQTIITKFNLVCDKAWIKPTLVSVNMVGKMVGGLVSGFVSDRFGRKVSFLAFTFLQFVLSFATSFSPNIVVYAIFLGLTGFSGVGNYAAIVVLGSEMVSLEKRGLAYFMTASGFAVGYMMLPLFVYLFDSWRWFLVFSGLVGVFYIPFYWWLDESPVWLLASGQKDKAEAVLLKIAAYNDQTKADIATTVALVEEKKTEDSRAETICSTFAQMAKALFLMGRLAIILFAWVVVSMTYLAIALNNDNLSGDRYLNIFFASVSELLSGFVYFFGVTTLGRRNSYISFMLITSIAVAGAPFLARWQGAVSVAASMLAKLTVGVSYHVIYTQTGELFPTTVRNSILCLCGAASRVGGMLSPFIIYAGESGDTTAPSIGMAIAVFVSALSYLFIPETKDTKLPQTTEEAKNLRRPAKLKTKASQHLESTL